MADTALQVTDLTTLDAELVEQTHSELNQLMQEAHPEVELTRGVVFDLLQYFSAVFGAKNQTEIDRVTRSSSLLEISKDPSLATDSIVDRVFSNYLIERQTGTTASGSVTIKVSKDISTVIPQGTVFTANGVNFVTETAFVGRATGSILQQSTDRELVPQSDGTFAFTIEAVAVEEGSAGNVSKDTKMIPAVTPANYVDSFAATDFIDGFPTETNQELLTRQQEGVAAKVWSGRVNISALVKADDERVIALSTIGFGDAEMSRDRHWIWPSSGGGRTDTYVRTRERPQEITVTKTATLVDKVETGGIWQFSVAKDEAPGFYEVRNIRLLGDVATTAGFEVQQDTRGVDLTGDDFKPDIEDVVEGVFSRYQTAIIQFLDTETAVLDLEIGATQEYEAGLLAMANVAHVQDELANDRDIGPAAADNLVKACIPCFLSVNFDVRLATGQEEPDTEQIANDLASYVNTLGFQGQLHASALADVIHDTLSGNAAVGAIDMFGRILRPDLQEEYVRDDALLEIPSLDSVFVSGRTVGFILDPNDIGITVVAAGFPNV